jgi:hypothetical protein
MYCVTAGADSVSFRRPILKFGRRFRPHFRRRKKRKLFRPGVLSRVWCLGPCDDLRGCGPDLATQRSLRRTGAEISQEEFDDTRTRLDSDDGNERSWGTAGQHPEVSILRGELIGSIDIPLTCPGTMLEHTAFFSVRTSIVIVLFLRAATDVPDRPKRINSIGAVGWRP